MRRSPLFFLGLLLAVAFPAWPQTTIETDGDVEAQGFIGDGSQVTEVDAQLLDGLDSSAFAQDADLQNVEAISAMLQDDVAEANIAICRLALQAALPPPSPLFCSGAGPGKVFVTSAVFTGDLVSEANNLTGGTGCGGGPCTAGLEAGDAICQKLATDAGLPGQFKAWLSDDTANARYRLKPAGGPWFKVGAGGAKVEDDVASLGDLDSAINVDENGNVVNDRVFTGSLSSGFLFFNHCSGWTTTSGVATVGQSTSVSPTWSLVDSNTSCANSERLYCFQDL